MSASEATASATPAPPGRVKRHLLADRIYHWLMAASVLILMGTAFLPIIGWKFEWVSLHWMSGVVLALLVLIHIVRALVWQDWRAMVIDAPGCAQGWLSAGRAAAADKPGKYKILQKLYHLAVAVLVLAIVASGLLMLLKIDTPLWRRNPYWFAPDTWGVIYSIHGFASMALVTLVMIHIYFALRPDEWWLTRSMFRGWITGKEYLDHCDSRRWTTSDTAAER